jgi:hypothetical protein
MESKKAWQGEPDPPSQYSSNLERKGRPMNVHIGQSRLPSKGLVPAWLDDVKVSVFEVCNAQINSADTLAKANPEDRHLKQMADEIYNRNSHRCQHRLPIIEHELIPLLDTLGFDEIRQCEIAQEAMAIQRHIKPRSARDEKLAKVKKPECPSHRRTAIHEAGHATVLAAFGITVHRITVLKDALWENGLGGEVVPGRYPDGPEGEFIKAVVTCAGPLAVIRHVGEDHFNHADYDYELRYAKDPLVRRAADEILSENKEFRQTLANKLMAKKTYEFDECDKLLAKVKPARPLKELMRL